jgi:Ribbon-helix-helix protein, copG family
MHNVTITLDEETLARVRVKAAERNLSLSRFVGEVLREHTRGDDEYERAMRRVLSHKPVALGRPGERYPTRDEIHDRAAMREGPVKKKGKRR